MSGTGRKYLETHTNTRLLLERMSMTLLRPARPLFTDSRTAWVIAACLIAAAVLIGNSNLVLGKATPIWDADAYYAPMFSLVADYAKAGKLLLWNPWINGGGPDFADPQTGATSPVLLAFAVLSHNPMHGFVAYWISFWIFGGVGMLLLCRHLKCPVWGGLIAALGFVASGMYTGHGEHTTILYSFSFLPWIIWRFDIALSRHSYWNMVEAGVLWGLSALGGYPALIILDPIFLGLWGLGRSWFQTDKIDFAIGKGAKDRLIFTLAGLCLFAVIGVAVMGPSYIGFMNYAKGYTTRTGTVSLDYALIGPLPPQALGTFASPFLYLLRWEGSELWRETDISMCNIYMGVLVMSLAAIALLRVQKWRLWVGAIILFFLSCALGNHLPVRGWLYYLVPPTRYFRFPSLFSAYGIAGFCILAAYGSRDIDLVRITNETEGRRRFAVIAGAVALAAALAYFSLLGAAHLKIHDVSHPTKTFLLLWISTVVLFVLWWRRDVSSRLLLVGLVSIAMYDAVSAFRISADTMYSYATLSWWHIMSSRHVKDLDLTSHGLDRQLLPPHELGDTYNNHNVPLKIAVVAADTGMANKFFKSYVADPILSQLAVGAQRIWFSTDPVWLAPSDGDFADYVKVSHALGVPPLVLHSSKEMLASGLTASKPELDSQDWLQKARPLSRANIDLVSYWPNRLSFRYNATQDGWLLVTDRWAPYWTATVNGRHEEIVGANFLFRAIPVSSGENMVVFHYEPHGYIALVILSWGTIALVAIWGIARRIQFRRARAQPNYLAESGRSAGESHELAVS